MLKIHWQSMRAHTSGLCGAQFLAGQHRTTTWHRVTCKKCQVKMTGPAFEKPRAS